MKIAATLSAVLALLACGYSDAQAQSGAPERLTTVAARDQVPACSDARAQELAKEVVVRWIIVTGDRALIERGALSPADAFLEDELQIGMSRLVDVTTFVDVREEADLGVRRRCVARMRVAGWKDFSMPVAFQIQATQDASRFSVNAQAPVLAMGPEGFNLLIALRSVYGKALRPS